jgi:arsenate reductase
MTQHKLKILFACEGSVDRAVIAEGLLRAAADDSIFEVYSASTEAPTVSTYALEVMREIDIPIEDCTPKFLDDYEELQFDHVITLCEEVNSFCMGFPKDIHISHWQVQDPSLVSGTHTEIMHAYKEVRDAISVRIEAWLEAINSEL